MPSYVPGSTSVQGSPGDALPFCLLVQLKFSQGPRHCSSKPCSGLDGVGTRSGVGQPDHPGFIEHVPNEFCPHVVWPSQPHVCYTHGWCCDGGRSLLDDGGVPRLPHMGPRHYGPAATHGIVRGTPTSAALSSRHNIHSCTYLCGERYASAVMVERLHMRWATR